MKFSLKSLTLGIAMGSFLGLSVVANAQSVVSVDPGQTWLGYMNVFNRPQDGGGFQFGGPWGTADLTATWSGPTLTLGPNTIGDPNPYWYIGGGAPGAEGNKIMEANMYVEATDVYNGQTLTFEGTVLSNSLLSSVNQSGNGWTSFAFIKDFAPDYSSVNTTTVALTPGNFSISLALDSGTGRHVQYGFATTGPNVWITDAAPYGNIQITAVPEPGTMAALGLGALAAMRRRRSNKR